MKAGDHIHRVQRVIWRATVIIFILVCAGTVLAAFMNKDLITGTLIMAYNLVVGGCIWGVMKLVRKMTASLYGPPPKD